ncbi:hypothetical protein G6O69_23620 [Pseudenhygromyxa sp. WMMC2535]|uniref:hypothetical protein n=1 Tax=Pseudenhygromyxa sp. WMMC2535 TaxID=2712867 RepID=UPI001595EB70|nr:hypothetical protein [Pseudenhygromyxa sp. WMMC2535]NVB40848.1 hypothetical protein [Pseudenhygromyxa sp. WMMC2535]
MNDAKSKPAALESAPLVAPGATPDPADVDLGRRGALIRLLEVGVGVAGAALLTSGAREGEAEARRPPPPIEPQQPLVSLHVETAAGESLPSFAAGDDLWIAGVEGQRYRLHLQNHSRGRVEVVVSVDGRDVISGKLGDYAKQRGYVIDPFASLTIEGYRQSFDDVAAFRFADLADSYSARMGTPGNVGVIGVAAFSERTRAVVRRRPLAPVEGEPFPGEDAAPTVASPRSSSSRATTREVAKAKGAASGGSDEGRGEWAMAEDKDRSVTQLGTEYGERRYSPVEEVSFKRAHRKKPDQLVVVRYDSISGLQARGIIRDVAPVRTWEPEPVRTWEPEPRRDFAPPPPPRDWWR